MSNAVSEETAMHFTVQCRYVENCDKKTTTWKLAAFSVWLDKISIVKFHIGGNCENFLKFSILKSYEKNCRIKISVIFLNIISIWWAGFLPFLSSCFIGRSAGSRSDDGRQLKLLLLSGGPRGKKVCPQWRQVGVCPLPHQVLRQLLRWVPSTHPCRIKGKCFQLPLYFPSMCLSLNSPVPSHIRSSAIRAGTGMRSVSVVQSVTSLWPRSPSAPRTTASCAGSAAPERMLHAATAVTNPYWLVRQSTSNTDFVLLAEKHHTQGVFGKLAHDSTYF